MDVNEHNRTNHQSSKIRLTVFCAKQLQKQEFFSLPDPFCKVEVDGTRQAFVTEICKDTVSPKWNVYFDLNLSSTNSITITIYNNKREAKKPNSGFMGCVRIMPNVIQQVQDTGFQRMNLHKTRLDGNEAGKAGQIVISLLLLNNNVRAGGSNNSHHNYESIDMNNENEPNQPSLTFLNDNGLPDGWEERKTSTGRVYYVNHNER